MIGKHTLKFYTQLNLNSKKIHTDSCIRRMGVEGGIQQKKTVVVSLSCELRLIYLILICFPEKGEFKILYPSYKTFLSSESCVFVCIL